jgi:hypothetical protein
MSRLGADKNRRENLEMKDHLVALNIYETTVLKCICNIVCVCVCVCVCVYVDVDSIQVIQDKILWRAVLRIVIKTRVP